MQAKLIIAAVMYDVLLIDNSDKTLVVADLMDDFLEAAQDPSCGAVVLKLENKDLALKIAELIRDEEKNKRRVGHVLTADGAGNVSLKFSPERGYEGLRNDIEEIGRVFHAVTYEPEMNAVITPFAEHQSLIKAKDTLATSFGDKGSYTFSVEGGDIFQAEEGNLVFIKSGTKHSLPTPDKDINVISITVEYH